MTAIVGMAKRMLRSVATRGRILAMSAIGLVGIVIGFAIDRSDPGPEWIPTEFLANFGLTTFVPLVSLVFASATLGTLREEGTLAYFWLRPIGRWKIAASAMAASLLVLIPVVLVPMAALGLAIGDSADVSGMLVGSLLGVIAYTAVFTLFGLVTVRALVWGLVYIVAWEGFVAGLSATAGKLAVRTYATSALGDIADFPELIAGQVSLSTAVIVVVAIAVACFGLTTLRLHTMDVD